MSHVLPVDLTGSQLTKYSKWATILVNPPVESLQHLYDWLFVSASSWLDKGLSQENLELAFELLMSFYTGEVDCEINAEGVVHTREAILCTWDQQCNNALEEQQHISGAPGDTANGDKESAPESMQLDNMPNVPAPQPADQPPAAQAKAVEGSAAAEAAALVATATAVNNTSVNELSDSSAQHAADGPQAAKTRLIEQVMTNSALTNDQKIEWVRELSLALEKPTTVSSSRSNSRSSPPEPFHGKSTDHWQTANTWLYGLELYFQAEPTLNPVAKAVTYLHGGAQHWWQQVGNMLMPANPTLSGFAKVFLARFVKPSDSAAARIEITTLKQTGSVEAFAAHFRSVNSRITVGSPIDTTTLATHFINGLKGKVVKALATVTSLETMQNVDLIMIAAEEMEAKLNIADKQAHPTLAALNADERHSAPHGGQRAARQHRNNQHRNHPYNCGGTGRGRHVGNNPANGRGFGPGRGYYNPGRGNSNPGRGYNKPSRGYYNPTRGYNTSDNHTRNYHGTYRGPVANSGFVPTQGANSTPIASRNANAANQGAGGRDGGGLWCRWCQTSGHDIWDCWAARRTYEQSTQSRQVSFSSDAYHHAYAVSTADAQLPLHSSAVCASTDLADVLAGIGTPLPYNAMPDPTAFNARVTVGCPAAPLRPQGSWLTASH